MQGLHRTAVAVLAAGAVGFGTHEVVKAVNDSPVEISNAYDRCVVTLGETAVTKVGMSKFCSDSPVDLDKRVFVSKDENGNSVYTLPSRGEFIISASERINSTLKAHELADKGWSSLLAIMAGILVAWNLTARENFNRSFEESRGIGGLL